MKLADIKPEILKYCAEEVDRQGDHALAVYWMIEAWQQAQSDWHAAGFTRPAAEYLKTGSDPGQSYRVIKPDWIKQWGILVQPEHNSPEHNSYFDNRGKRGPGGFRIGTVFVGSRRCPEAILVPRLVENLCEAISEGRLDADTAYYEFEMIHPFFDGNGRTGKILYNYIKGTLDEPVMPPNFFGCSNP